MTPSTSTMAAGATPDENSLTATEAAGGLWSDVWRRFRRNPIALGVFYVVCFLFFIALFADFLANDKPYYLEYRGKVYFPIFRSYLVGAKLGQRSEERRVGKEGRS